MTNLPSLKHLGCEYEDIKSRAAFYKGALAYRELVERTSLAWPQRVAQYFATDTRNAGLLTRRVLEYLVKEKGFSRETAQEIPMRDLPKLCTPREFGHRPRVGSTLVFFLTEIYKHDKTNF